MRGFAVACLLLSCVGCAKDGLEEGVADEAEDSGGTETGALEARCEEQLTQSACNDLVAPDESWQCEWVNVWTSNGSCEEGTTQAQCVTFNSPGAGCSSDFACGAETEAGGPRMFFRDLGEAGVQIVGTEVCGLDPEWGVWEQCQWDEMGNVTPHPACACGC